MAGDGQARGNKTKTALVQTLRTDFPLPLLLKLMNLKRSSFFYHLAGKVDKSISIRQQIIEIKRENKAYGYRRVTACLKGVNHKVVQRLMQEMGLQVHTKTKRKYRSYRGDVGKIAPNLLQRNFKAEKPNEKWLTDVTEFKAKDGNKLYLSPILDCFNNELIAYQLSRSPNWSMVKLMLHQAVEKLPKNAKPILHSDQGWHYQMRAYQQILNQNGIQQSMSRKGNCLDNAAMESFFGRLKSECFYDKVFETVNDIAEQVEAYIRYYNEERIQLKLKGLSPIQYRAQSFS